jgi:hypothetical protein
VRVAAAARAQIDHIGEQLLGVERCPERFGERQERIVGAGAVAALAMDHRRRRLEPGLELLEAIAVRAFGDDVHRQRITIFGVSRAGQAHQRGAVCDAGIGAEMIGEPAQQALVLGFAFCRGRDRFLEYPVQVQSVPGVNHQGRRRRQALDDLQDFFGGLDRALKIDVGVQRDQLLHGVFVTARGVALKRRDGEIGGAAGPIPLGDEGADLLAVASPDVPLVGLALGRALELGIGQGRQENATGRFAE